MQENYLQTLREIKSVAFATVGDDEPHVRIADVMMVEEDKIYFTTARGKAFYRQLRQNPVVALVGMTKEYRMIRVTGEARLVGREYIDRIFEQNPMMNDLYPGEKRDIMDPFCIEKGRGECFDLSSVPPSRQGFAFGGGEVAACAYRITDACIACGACRDRCPENAISAGDIYTIDAAHCLACGRCAETCPTEAIRMPSVF